MKVAVGLIFNAKNEILISRRAWQQSHGGYWEFPGGKLEAEETVEDALIREVKEETGLRIQALSFALEIKHQYPDKAVHLLVYKSHSFTGEPSCQEKQLDMRWVAVSDLLDYPFPEANRAIIAHLTRN